jgi:hypothetical protein
MIQRRSFIIGLGGLVGAPAIVRATSIMSVKGIIQPILQSANDPGMENVLYTIYGWNSSELVFDENGSNLIVRCVEPLSGSSEAAQDVPMAIHLSQSWRTSWR